MLVAYLISESLGMPVPHGYFVIRSCCQPSSKAVGTDFNLSMKNSTIECIYGYWWKNIFYRPSYYSKCHDKVIFTEWQECEFMLLIFKTFCKDFFK